jgi:hypothetical protein
MPISSILGAGNLLDRFDIATPNPPLEYRAERIPITQAIERGERKRTVDEVSKSD